MSRPGGAAGRSPGRAAPGASPVAQVLAAFESGVGSAAGIAVETGLPLDLVQAILDHLVRIGTLRATPLSAGCPIGATSCASCGVDPGEGAVCSATPQSARGPVLIEIVRPGVAGPTPADPPARAGRD